jgi:hypothetical protein
MCLGMQKNIKDALKNVPDIQETKLQALSKCLPVVYRVSFFSGTL